VKYTDRPVYMLTDNRGWQAGRGAKLAKVLGYSRAPDLLARVAFDPEYEPITNGQYKSADCVILKSFFAPPIENPGINKGVAFVVEFRGDDCQDYRRTSVALGLQSFLINLKASGTRWRGFALGPETIVLIKEKRKNRPPFTLALVGEGYSPDMVASDDMVRDRAGAGDPEKWGLLLQAIVSYFDAIEVTTVSPYPELLDRGIERSLLVCAGRKGVRAFRANGGASKTGARDDCAEAWETALYAAGTGPLKREGGTVHFKRNEGKR